MFGVHDQRSLHHTVFRLQPRVAASRWEGFSVQLQFVVAGFHHFVLIERVNHLAVVVVYLQRDFLRFIQCEADRRTGIQRVRIL